MRLEIVLIRLLRQRGIEDSDETAIAIGAVRFETLRIHLLRQLGVYSADKTAAVSYRPRLNSGRALLARP